MQFGYLYIISMCDTVYSNAVDVSVSSGQAADIDDFASNDIDVSDKVFSALF